MAGFFNTMFIKRILFRLLSIKGYLKLVSSLFFFSYFSGLLRNKEKFAFHYFIRNLIRPGDTIIDIGGNLGYYAVAFGKLTGEKGKVYAVEPVSVFRSVLERNIRKRSLSDIVEIVPYALGSEDQKKIRLGIPSGNKNFRHGLTRVVDDPQSQKSDYEFEETMMRPETLFGKLERIDYIKCDVEGYEIHIVPELLSLLQKHLPLIQMETDGDNRIAVNNMLGKLGYVPHYVKNNKIHALLGNESFHTGDVLYIPDNKKNVLKPLMA